MEFLQIILKTGNKLDNEINSTFITKYILKKMDLPLFLME